MGRLSTVWCGWDLNVPRQEKQQGNVLPFGWNAESVRFVWTSFVSSRCGAY